VDLFWLFGTFLVTLALGVPVAVCLGLSSLAYIVAAGLPLVVIPAWTCSCCCAFPVSSSPAI
jgi:C4-dicarboxylate transporter, DctM subunit